MRWELLKTNTKALVAVSSGLSAAAAATVAYVAASKVLEKKFREIADLEIQEAKVYYQVLYSRPVFVEEPTESEEAEDENLMAKLRQAAETKDGIPVDLVGEALGALQRYSPTDEEKEASLDKKPEPEIINTFQNYKPPGEEVLGALMADRNPAEPYIITKEEYYENSPDHEQQQFTYYEGDAILVDDREEFNPIDNVELVAGEDNLLRFGYGSADEHTVYIRNEAMDPPMDLYVTRSTGKYAIEVMGLDDGEPHLQHSQRRFRIHDE